MNLRTLSTLARVFSLGVGIDSCGTGFLCPVVAVKYWNMPANSVGSRYCLLLPKAGCLDIRKSL